jgi:hypothetical protein
MDEPSEPRREEGRSDRPGDQLVMRDLGAAALRCPREHRTLRDRIAEALLEPETLDGGDLAWQMAE